VRLDLCRKHWKGRLDVDQFVAGMGSDFVRIARGKGSELVVWVVDSPRAGAWARHYGALMGHHASHLRG
jgi:hypothetical protein